MALEDKMQAEQQGDPSQVTVEQLTDDEEDDLRIMVTLAKNLIDDGGYEVIDAAENSKDPGQVIGQFLMQMVSQMAEQLPEDVKPSPRIFLCEGGWVEQISDYLQEDYDLPRDVADRAEMYIGSASQAIAQGQQQPGGPAGPPASSDPMAAQQQAAPAMPQGAM